MKAITKCNNNQVNCSSEEAVKLTPVNKKIINLKYVICVLSVASFLKIYIRSEGFNDPRMTSGKRAAYIIVNGNDHSPYRRGHNVVIVDAETGIAVFCRDPWHTFIKNEIENRFTS